MNGDEPCTCGNADGSSHVYDEHDEQTGRCTVEGCDCLSFEEDEDALVSA